MYNIYNKIRWHLPHKPQNARSSTVTQSAWSQHLCRRNQREAKGYLLDLRSGKLPKSQQVYNREFNGTIWEEQLKLEGFSPSAIVGECKRCSVRTNGSGEVKLLWIFKSVKSGLSFRTGFYTAENFWKQNQNWGRKRQREDTAQLKVKEQNRVRNITWKQQKIKIRKSTFNYVSF